MKPSSSDRLSPQTADAETAEGAELRGKLPKAGGLLHRDITRVILGAFYSVHAELGFGFLEAVYENALVVLLKNAGMEVNRQVAFDVVFHGHNVGTYRADLVVDSRVIVEIKTGRSIIPQHAAQLLNYLRASRLQVGLLLHFGEKPEFRRVVWTRSHPRSSADSA